MPARKSTPPAPIYQLKITLHDFRPPIWRRVLVPADFTLAKLHWVMQGAMGWTNSHLHHFKVGETYYSLPIPGTDWEDMDEEDARRVTLGQVVPRVKAKFMYEYDFGDSWEHDVVVEKVLPPDPALKHPVCLKGRRACPPEDVGGVWGYAEFLEAIRDPDHEEHGSYWNGSAASLTPKRLTWRKSTRCCDGFGRDVPVERLRACRWHCARSAIAPAGERGGGGLNH